MSSCELHSRQLRLGCGNRAATQSGRPPAVVFFVFRPDVLEARGSMPTGSVKHNIDLFAAEVMPLPGGISPPGLRAPAGQFATGWWSPERTAQLRPVCPLGSHRRRSVATVRDRLADRARSYRVGNMLLLLQMDAPLSGLVVRRYHHIPPRPARLARWPTTWTATTLTATSTRSATCWSPAPRTPTSTTSGR